MAKLPEHLGLVLVMNNSMEYHFATDSDLDLLARGRLQ